MSTSSKYAALPFIASGEKDIFETDDLPEADQITSFHQQQPIKDAAIEEIPCGTVEAFHKFSTCDRQQQQQSQKIETGNESLQEKFNRIKLELDELVNAVDKTNDKVDVNVDVNDLTKKLANLQEICSTTALPSIKIPSAKELKSSSADAADTKKDGGGEQPLLKYELFRSLDKEQLIETSKINYLEQRIKKIETILGMIESRPNSSTYLSSYLKDQSIMSAVVQLSNKVIQLDHSSLDQVDSRLNAIIEKLNQISAKKSSLENVQVLQKLNELHNCYVKTAQGRPTLVNVVERLQVLSEVQNQAYQFSATLASMDQTQNEIQLSLEKNSRHLQTLKELIESKSAEMQIILDDFRKRLEKLQ